MKSISVMGFALTVFASSAMAQDSPPAVESMNCAQMSAEMMSAGQTIKSQLDPNYLQDMQRAAADIRQQRDTAAAAAPSMTASSIACGFGALPACAANAVQGRQLDAVAKANAPRNEAYAERGISGALDATRGLDMGRMQALSARFESQECQRPR